jgi:hypothetical protein
MNREMARSKNKQKKGVKQKEINKDDSFNFQIRRCSMKVNLSFVSNLSDSEHSLLKSASIESVKSTPEESVVHDDNVLETLNKCVTKTSNTNAIHINNGISPFLHNSKETTKIQNSLIDIKEKEQQLNKSCMQLKDAIMNKTKALFDQENELAIKTSKVLATGYSLSTDEIIDVSDKRSPSIKVNIGKNDQIIMSGDGRKRNPVQVNSMLSHSLNNEHNISLEKISNEYMLCNKSITSTPKKSRTERYINEKDIGDKTPPIISRIPVTRLFDDENHSNNESNKCDISHKLSYTSPILSQGIRRSRVSRLSLKKKLTQISSDSSSPSVINENLCDKNMFACSSFIDTKSKSNRENEICTTSNEEEKNKIDNYNTIDLVEDNNKTISISSSSKQSSMEITSIASHVPIIHRSFQNICKTVLIDNMPSTYNGIKNYNLLIKEQVLPDVHKNKNSNKIVNSLEPLEQIEINNASQNISLDENTTSDQMKLTDCIIQKENKIPNNTENKSIKINKMLSEEDGTVSQQSNAYSVTSSMQVSTSIDNVKTIIVPSTMNQELDKSNKLICLKSSIDISQDKINNDITSRQPSTSTIRSSMQVNTSLDSIRKSPIIKNKLNFNNILSMVQESSYNNINQNKITTSTSKSIDSDSDLENVSLMERIANISKIKRTNNIKLNNTGRNYTETQNLNLNKVKKSTEMLNIDSNTSSKSITSKSTSLVSNNSSIVEATPFPTSRSVLYKTMIKKSIVMNTLNPQRCYIDTLSDDEDSNNKFQTIISNNKVSPIK